MSVEFDTPVNRIIAQQAPKNQFRIDTSLPDIAFLRQLSVQGRLRYFIGSTTGTNNTITITPQPGETLFIYRVIFSTLALSVGFNLVNDGTTRLDIKLGINLSTNAITIDFFDSLVGNGTRIFEVNVVNAGIGSGETTLLGWVENTSRIRDVAP